MLPTGDTVSREGDSNVGATIETGEPPTIAGTAGVASVWYSWTPAHDVRVRVDTTNSDFDTLLAVYTGSAVNALTEVASSDDVTFDDPTSQLAFNATGGTTYHIRVDGPDAPNGAGTVNLHILPTPSNDDFAGATPLSGNPLSLTDSNVGATLEPGEDPLIAGGLGEASLWYTWTAPERGLVTIDTEGSSFDTLLGVYTGDSVGALTEVASNDDDPNKTDHSSLVAFHVDSGTTFHIKVDGYNGAMGSITMHLSEAPPPPNDNFADATVLSGKTVSREADTNVGASLETGEPTTVAGSPAGASIWYAWTAPADGHVKIDTSGSSFDTLLGVYTGTAVDDLHEVASNDDEPTCVSCASAVDFDVTSGTTYRVRVDGYDGAIGAVHLHVALATVADAPTGVSAAAGDANATVTWTPPVSDGGSTITGYRVTPYVGDVAQPFVSVGAVTQTTVGGLTNGTAYTFTVAAVNAIGASAESAASTAVTPRGDQTITVTKAAPASAVPGSSFTVDATAPGGAVTFSSSGACSNSGNTFTMTSGTGTCSVKFDQGGSAGFNPAPQVIESVTAQKAAQTIHVTTPAPSNAVYGAGFTVAATGGGSGNAVTFSSSGACSHVNGTFTMTSGTGTCSVQFDQAGNDDYAPASTIVEQVTAQKASQAISVTTHAPSAAVSGSSFTVAATAPGGGVAYSSGGSCTNAGPTFTMTSGTGTCSVRYDQAGNDNYGAAPQVVESVTAAPVTFALNVSKSGPGSGTVSSSVGGIDCGVACSAEFAAGTSVTLTASASPGSKFTGWSGACTGAGACTVVIDATTSVTASFAVATPPKRVYCIVPNVVGTSLGTAKRKIAAAHCKTGKTATARSKKVKKGNVISQSPKAGKKLPSGTKVNLLVSRGRR